MGEYGFQDVNRASLDVASWRKLVWTANWRMGARLLGTARYYRLFHDDAYLDKHTSRLASYVTRLRVQLRGRRHLLDRERFSADVWLKVYGLHSQAVAWQGLREMASVWAETGRPGLAARARGVGLRARARATARGAKVVAKDARRHALRPDPPARRRASLPLPHGVTSGQLLEPRDALRARVRDLPAARHAGQGRVPVPPRARLAHPRARSRRRLHALRADRHEEVRDGSGLRAQPRTLLRGQRQGRPARAQPLRAARGGDDTRDVRRRRGRERRAVPRRLLPRDVPPAELREQLRVPRDAAG